MPLGFFAGFQGADGGVPTFEGGTVRDAFAGGVAEPEFENGGAKREGKASEGNAVEAVFGIEKFVHETSCGAFQHFLEFGPVIFLSLPALGKARVNMVQNGNNFVA